MKQPWLLSIIPDKIAIESEHSPLNKEKYIHDSIKLAISRKSRVDKIIQDNVTPICSYIKDSTIDCDLKERIKIIEKTDNIPQNPLKYESGTEYKFNLKINESGDWYINKMKLWNMIPAPQMSTLEIEKKYREEELKNKSIKFNSNDRDENDMLMRKATRPPSDFQFKGLPYEKTDVEIAEDEAVKEEQELLFQEYQERINIQNQSNFPKI